MINVDERRPFELNGKHVAMMFCAFFGIIIVVNVSMAMLASSSWTGLVVRNSYVASQKFNAELLEARTQEQQGWKSSVRLDESLLVVQIENASNTGIHASTASLEIGRPAFEQMDQRLEGTVQGNTVLFNGLSLQPGLWQAKIVVEHGDGFYRRDFRLYVTEDGKARVDP